VKSERDAAKGGAFDRRARHGMRECSRDTIRAGAVQLIGILNGESSMVGKVDAWNWTKVAFLHHCA
jgi:hypothetical protein